MDERQIVIGPPRLLNWLAAATVVLYLAAIGFGVFVFLNARHTTNDLRDAARRNATAVAALCAIRRAEGHRLAASEEKLRTSGDYLRQHPNGAPGIPRALIIKGIADAATEVRNEKQTL